MSIVFAILIFSFLIFIHEFGHFVTAKLFGVQVNEFSMFMGPAIRKKQKGETLYSLRCIPIGGYCAMEGEDGDSDNPRAFGRAAWWKRVIILIAGATMNFLAGFLIVLILGMTVRTTVPQVDFLRTGSTLAAEGGLMAGDTVLELDGTPIGSTADFSEILAADEEKTVYDVLVMRDGTQVLLKNVVMEPREFAADAEGEAGTFYGINWKTRHLTFAQTVDYAWQNCVYFVKVVWMSLGMLLSGEASLGEVSGVVGIVHQMGQIADASATWVLALENLLYFGAFIAVNLAVMNLLPIPALDGGRVVSLLLTAAIEAVTRKKLDPKYEGYVHAAGMVLLLGLMAVIMLKDIIFIFK